MLVTLDRIIADAEKGGYCVPAFDVYNIETIMGVIKAAEQARSPVIIMVYPRLINEEVGFYIAPAVVAAANRATVPVCFELDHGPSEYEITRSLRWGMTGIMIDGSSKPFDENVAITKHIVETCGSIGVGVEGELGHIGSVNDAEMGEYTDPDLAAEFVQKTGICCLAVLIGNAHGHYKTTPHIDIDRVERIRKTTGNFPLVLHGGTGIPEDQVRAAVKAGVRKMNIGTDVCCSFADATLKSLNDPDRSLAVDLFMKKAIDGVKELALSKMDITNSIGKA